MAGLVSWSSLTKKKRQDDGVLNSLSNLDVRTNNAVSGQGGIVNRIQNAVNQVAKANNVSMTSRPTAPSTLKTLNNLDVRTNNTVIRPIQTSVNRINNFNSALSRINQANGGVNQNDGKMSFDDFKATMSAKNIINNGGTGAPLKASAIKNAQTIGQANRLYDEAHQNDFATPSNNRPNANMFRGLEQYTAKDKNYYSDDTLRLNRPAATSLRTLSDESAPERNQILLSKTFKPVLDGNMDAAKVSFRSVLDSYNRASGDQQADVRKALSDEIISQRERAKQGDNEALDSINYLSDLNSLLTRYGSNKNKSLLRQLADNATTGGFIGDIGGNSLEQLLGQITGKADKINSAIEKQNNTRTDLGAVGIADAALGAAANFGLNLGTAGKYGIAKAAVDDINAVKGLNDKVLDYDDNGNAYIREKTNSEKVGEVGMAGLNSAFSLAGIKGIGPGLGNGTLKDVAKYAAQELPWAGATTYLQTGLGNLAQNKDWHDMDAGQFAKDLALNLGQDIGMDVANLGRARAMQNINRLSTGESIRTTDDGSILKQNPDGTETRLTDRELADVAKNNPIQNAASKIANVADNAYSTIVNRGAVDRLARGIERGTDGNIRFVRINKETLADINMVRQAKGLEPLTNRQVIAYQNAVNNNLNNRYKENPEVMTPKRIAEIAFDSLTNSSAESLPGKGGNTVNVAPYREGKYSGSVIGLAQDGGTSLKSIEPRTSNEVSKMRQQKSDLLGLPGSPLVANQEGGVTQSRVANSDNSATSLVNPRAGSPDAPLGVLNTSIPQHNKSVNPDNALTRLADLSPELSKKISQKFKDKLKKIPVGMSLDDISKDAKPISEVFKNLSSDDAKEARLYEKAIVDGYYKVLLGADVNGGTETIPTPDGGYKRISYNQPIYKEYYDANGGRKPLRRQIQEDWDIAVGKEEALANIANKKTAQNAAVQRLESLRQYNENLETPGGFRSILDSTINYVSKNENIKPNNTSDSTTVASEISAGIEPLSKAPDGTPQGGSDVKQNSASAKVPLLQEPKNINQDAKTTRLYASESESLPDNFDVKHYVSDQVAAQQKRSKLPLKERIADATAELKHYLIDDAVAYERYIKDKNERLNIREGVDLVGRRIIKKSQYMKDHGLTEIGKMSDEDMNEFQQYLIAKRALEVADQGKKTGRSRAADEALIARIGDKYAKQEQIIRKYTRDMLEYSADNGLISQKLKNDLLRDNPNYVPMNRVFDVLEKKTGFKSKQLGNLDKQTVVQKLTGSDRAIEDPIESLMNNTFRMINEVERNKTAKLITDSKAFHEKVLADGQEPLPGYDKLSYLVDGEKVSYEVPKLVAEEMKNLNSTLPNFAEYALRIAGAPTKWLRSGATQNNPLFALSNLMRDQMQTVVTGKVTANIKGLKDATIATFSPGKKGKALRDELSRAGIIGNEYRQTYGYKPGELIKQLQNDSKLGDKALERAKHPINALADLIGKTEYFTRAQQYFGTDGDAVVKAQAARNNTLNFGRAGATTRILNRVIPFLNAGIQGGRITINSFKERPVHTTLAMASLGGLALAARAAFEAQDKELWDRLDDSDKGQNIIIPTENAHYNPDTNRIEGVIKIPVAQMLYPIMDIVNNLKGDSSDFAQLAGDIFTATTGLEAPNSENGMLPVVNQLTPTIVKPVLETAMNKSSYTGNEIVSDYDSEKAPEDKGAKYTTGAARIIASKTGIDAPVIDNFIQNWGGGLAKDLTRTMTDNPDNKSDGGGFGNMFGGGFNRRFLSGTVTSQYEIAEGLAKNYKEDVKKTDAFNNLSGSDKEKVLRAISSDMKSIASMATKVEQDKTGEIGDDKLSKRQTEIIRNGFNANSYITSVMTKNKTPYSSNSEDNGGISGTLSGNILDYGNTNNGRKNPIKISDNLQGASKTILEKYNSMTSDDWNKYLYNNASAEYNLAKAKYDNDAANGKITDVSKIKRQNELEKLSVSKNWTKDVREAYSLAGTKADIQEYLNSITDNEKRSKVIGMLNGLNNAMYKAGLISKSTYNSRGRNINNLTKSSSKKSSKKSSSSDGISQAEATAIAKATKSLSDSSYGYDVKTTKAPTTNRQLQKTRSKNNKTTLASYAPKKASITVKKGSKK